MSLIVRYLPYISNTSKLSVPFPEFRYSAGCICGDPIQMLYEAAPTFRWPYALVA